MTAHTPMGNEGYCKCGYYMPQTGMNVCVPQLQEELAEQAATIARLTRLLIVDYGKRTECRVCCAWTTPERGGMVHALNCTVPAALAEQPL